MAGYNEAVRRGHRHVLPEHVILGLLHEEEGIAARAVAALGTPLPEARDRVATALPRPEPSSADPSRPAGRLPFSPQASDALGRSLREAARLGHNYVGTEHILLGLLAAGSPTLTALGVTTERAEPWILSVL